MLELNSIDIEASIALDNASGENSSLGQESSWESFSSILARKTGSESVEERVSEKRGSNKDKFETSSSNLGTGEERLQSQEADVEAFDKKMLNSKLEEKELKTPHFWKQGPADLAQDFPSKQGSKPSEQKLHMDFPLLPRQVLQKGIPSKEGLNEAFKDFDSEQALLEFLQREYFVQSSLETDSDALEQNLLFKESDFLHSKDTIFKDRLLNQAREAVFLREAGLSSVSFTTPQGRKMSIEKAKAELLTTQAEQEIEQAKIEGTAFKETEVSAKMDLWLKEGALGKEFGTRLEQKLELLGRQLDQVDNYRITQKAHFLLKDNKVADIQLNLWPKNLGKVQVHLNLEGAHLVGKFVVHNLAVKEVFEGNLSSFQNALRDLGYENAAFDVTFSGEGSQQASDQGEFFSQNLKDFDEKEVGQSQQQAYAVWQDDGNTVNLSV